MKRPTIGDIARRAEVSKAAVSYALNGRPGVSEETRERVWRIAHALGWRAHNAAVALSAKRAGTVGLVITGPAASWAMLQGIERELATERVALQIAIVRDAEAAETYRDWWAARRVDGVLVIDPRPGDPRIPLLRELTVPTVLVGAHASGMSAVVGDPTAECRRVVEHLAERGHTTLGYVTGQTGLYRNVHRREALRRVARELLDAVPAQATGDGVEATRQLLATPDRPSAVIYDDATAAAATVAHASVLNVLIPTELAVIARGDSPVCRLVHPSITAIRHNEAADGATAARLLLHHLTTGIPEQRPAAPSELVIRATT